MSDPPQSEARPYAKWRLREKRAVYYYHVDTKRRRGRCCSTMLSKADATFIRRAGLRGSATHDDAGGPRKQAATRPGL